NGRKLPINCSIKRCLTFAAKPGCIIFKRCNVNADLLHITIRADDDITTGYIRSKPKTRYRLKGANVFKYQAFFVCCSDDGMRNWMFGACFDCRNQCKNFIWLKTRRNCKMHERWPALC